MQVMAADDQTGRVVLGLVGALLAGLAQSPQSTETYGGVCTYCNNILSISKANIDSSPYGRCPYCGTQQLITDCLNRYNYLSQQRSIENRPSSYGGTCGSCQRYYKINNISCYNVTCPHCSFVESTRSALDRYNQSLKGPLYPPQKSTELTTKEILKQNINTGVTILLYGDDGEFIGHGSGFFIDKEGRILTNCHVIAPAYSLAVVHGNTMHDRAALVNYDEEKDLAIIKICEGNQTHVTLSDSSKVQQGDKIIVISTPQDPRLPNTVSEGIISSIRQGDKLKSFQITAPTSPGSSGGAVFNTQGKVVGLVQKGIKAEGAQNLNFAVPVNDAIPLLYSMNSMFMYPSAGSKNPKTTKRTTIGKMIFDIIKSVFGVIF
jgi:hypothetical protein